MNSIPIHRVSSCPSFSDLSLTQKELDRFLFSRVPAREIEDLICFMVTVLEILGDTEQKDLLPKLRLDMWNQGCIMVQHNVELEKKIGSDVSEEMPEQLEDFCSPETAWLLKIFQSNISSMRHWCLSHIGENDADQKFKSELSRLQLPVDPLTTSLESLFGLVRINLMARELNVLLKKRVSLLAQGG